MSNAFQPELLAEETHSSLAWGLIILVLMGVPLVLVALSPSGVARWPLIFMGPLGIATCAMAWSGFQYRFLQHGVEIRMLGFRLRSIPRQEILSYSIEPWALMRGYGIRGIGRSRAYVWCNKVVHIKTSNGEVYLGHREPERIVRDLDQMMGLVSRG